ncbi:MAG: hypothetical protein ACRDO0_17960 [Nocardioidaceae bacterium]
MHALDAFEIDVSRRTGDEQRYPHPHLPYVPFVGANLRDPAPS